MNEAIDKEMDIDFKVILADTVVDKVAMMIQSIDAFLAMATVVVPWRLGFLAYATLNNRLWVTLGSQSKQLWGFLNWEAVVLRLFAETKDSCEVDEVEAVPGKKWHFVHGEDDPVDYYNH